MLFPSKCASYSHIIHPTPSLMLWGELCVPCLSPSLVFSVISKSRVAGSRLSCCCSGSLVFIHLPASCERTEQRAWSVPRHHLPEPQPWGWQARAGLSPTAVLPGRGLAQHCPTHKSPRETWEKVLQEKQSVFNYLSVLGYSFHTPCADTRAQIPAAGTRGY